MASPTENESQLTPVAQQWHVDQPEQWHVDQAQSWRELIKADWPQPQIYNVVATVQLDCALDLNVIAQQARNVEYNPKRLHALIMRTRLPRTTALIFASGKMVVTGAKSEALARMAALRHARAVQKWGFQTKFVDFKVQNFVSSVSCGFIIRLEGIAHQHWQSSKYEPALFPGLVFSMVTPDVKCLVFRNGKVVFTGAKDVEHVYEAFVKLFPVLLDFKVADDN